MKTKLHSILFGSFLLVISIPLFMLVFGYDTKPLEGAFQQIERKKVSLKTLLDGSYQVQLEQEEKSLSSIVPTLIRLRNQVDLDAFGIGHMGDGLIGKGGYIFGKGWANSYSGKRLYTDNYFDSISRKLKKVNELYDSLGKAFLVVIPPCKEGLFPEKLPFGYEKSGLNDYESYVQSLEKNRVRYVNFTEHYKNAIDTSKYPIYSKTSAHWTLYGASHALNIIVDSIENLLNTNLMDYKIKSIHQSSYDRGDGDQEGPLNLLFSIDNSQFAYPSYVFDTTKAYSKPKVIIVGDSFYWGINNSYVPLKIYSEESKYLYYYSTCYPNGDGSGYSVKELDLIEEFATADAFILITGSHNLNGFPFGLEKDFDAIIERLKYSTFGNDF